VWRNGAVVVEGRRLVRSFRDGEGDVRAIDGLDIAVRAGEFVAVVGPSGSGKTTLLNLLGAADRPTDGSVILGGVDLATLSDVELAAVRRRGVGAVLQSFALFPELRAWENAAVPALLDAIGRRAARRRAVECLARVGVVDLAERFREQLSSGQQQRVAIARALVLSPPLVLADEPTGNLDSAASRSIIDLLAGLADEGRAVVLVTHDREAAARADRVVELIDGRSARAGQHT
jgi:putative ABC transport system ATP-binding protein